MLLPIKDAIQHMTEGKSYSLNPYPNHMEGQVVGVFLAHKSKTAAGTKLPSVFEYVFSFKTEKSKTFHKMIDTWFDNLDKEFTNIHQKEREIGVDVNAIVEIPDSEFFY